MAKKEAGAGGGKPRGGKPKIDKAALRLVANAKAGADGKKTNLKLSSAGEDQAFDTNFKRCYQQFKVVKKSKEVVREEAGRYGELIRAAKDAGVNTTILKRTIATMELPPAEVAADMRELGWQLKRAKAPVALQFNLFNFGEPTLAEIEALGEQAGRDGVSMDEAPGKPGEDQNAHWISGWKKGQRESAEEVFGKGDGKPPTDADKAAVDDAVAAVKH